MMFVVFGLILGVLVGWTLKQHLSQRTPYTYHPEMFDGNGNVIPDELIAFSFENADHLEEEETED